MLTYDEAMGKKKIDLSKEARKNNAYKQYLYEEQKRAKAEKARTVGGTANPGITYNQKTRENPNLKLPQVRSYEESAATARAKAAAIERTVPQTSTAGKRIKDFLFSGKTGGTVNPTISARDFRTAYDFATDRETAVYRSLKQAGENERAEKYLKAIEPQLFQRQANKRKQEAKKLAEESTAGGLFSRYMAGLTAPLGAAYGVIQDARGQAVDPNHPLFLGEHIREGQTEGFLKDSKGVGRVLKEAGLGAFDWGTQLATFGGLGLGGKALGNAVSASYGTSAFGSNVRDAAERGATSQEAAAYGAIGAAAEVVTEKLGFERMFKLGKLAKNKGQLTQALLSLVPNMAAEGAEEATTEAVNALSDVIIMGDRSELGKVYNTSKAAGLTDGQAAKEAVFAGLKQIGYSGLVGAVSGGMIGGGVVGAGQMLGKMTGAEPHETVSAAPEPVNETSDIANKNPDIANKNPDIANKNPDIANKTPEPVNEGTDIPDGAKISEGAVPKDLESVSKVRNLASTEHKTAQKDPESVSKVQNLTSWTQKTEQEALKQETQQKAQETQQKAQETQQKARETQQKARETPQTAQKMPKTENVDKVERAVEKSSSLEEFSSKWFYNNGSTTFDDAFTEKVTKGKDINNLVPAFTTYYRAGLAGMPESQIRQTAFTALEDRGTLTAAYLAGARDRKEDIEHRLREGGKLGQSKGVYLKTDAVTKEQRALANLVAEVGGAEVVLVDHMQANGTYEKGKITVALDSESFSGTLFHESVHYIHEANPEGFDRMREAVFGIAAARENISVEAYAEKYEKRYSGKVRSYGDVLEEMTADAFQTIAADEAGMKDFVQKMQKENPSVLEKLKKFIEALLETLKGLLEDNRFSSFAADIGKDIKDTEKLRDLFVKELSEAGRRQEQAETTQGNGEKRYSLRDEEYMEAVNSGDMEKAQAMVNEAAEKAVKSGDVFVLENDGEVTAYKYHRGPQPKKKMIVYKTFNVDDMGGVTATYAGVDNPMPFGIWLDAVAQKYVIGADGNKYIPGMTGTAPKLAGLKSPGRYGFKGYTSWLSYRPAFHASTVPAPLQMRVKDPETGKRTALPHNKLIFKVEVSADRDYQEEAAKAGEEETERRRRYWRENKEFREEKKSFDMANAEKAAKAKKKDFDREKWERAYDAKGDKVIGTARAQLDHIPEMGLYKYKNNGEEWVLSGSFRILGVVTEEEVRRVNDAHGYPNKGKSEMNWIGGYHPEEFGLTPLKDGEFPKVGDPRYRKMKLADAVTYDDDGKVIPLSERFDPENNDIRYSLREEDLEALEKENEELHAENDYLKAQFKLTPEGMHDPASARTAARRWLKKMSSSYDLDKFTERFLKLCNLSEQAKTEEDYDRLTEAVTNLAEEAMRESTELFTADYEQYQDLFDYVKGKKIRVTKELEEELNYSYGSYNSFKKSNFGTINLSRNGTTRMDIMQDEMAARWPEKFKPAGEQENTAGDMLTHLVGVLDDLKPKRVDMFGEDLHEQARIQAFDLLDIFQNVRMAKPTFADKYESKLRNIEAKNAKKMEEMQEKARERERKLLTKQAEKLRERYKEWKQKEREHSREVFSRAKEELGEKKAKEIERIKARESKKNDELKLKLENERERQRETRDRQEYRKARREVEKTAKALLNWMEKPTEKYHVPKKMLTELEWFLKKINTSDPDIEVKKSELGILDDTMKELSSENSTFFVEYSDVLPDMIWQLFNDPGKAKKKKKESPEAEAKKTAKRARYQINKLSKILSEMQAEGDGDNRLALMIAENLKELEKSLEGYEETEEETEESVEEESKDTESIDESLKLADMTTEQMVLLNQIIKLIKKDITNANRMTSLEHTVSVAKVAKDFLDDADKRKAARQEGLIRKIGNFFNLDMLDPNSYFRELGPVVHDTIYRGLRKGFDKKVSLLREGVQKMNETISPKTAKKWRNEKPRTFTFDGTEITLTVPEIMSLYCLMKRKQAVTHIIKGGIRTGKTTKSRRKGKAVRENEAVRFSKEQIKTMTDTLTAEQKEAAEQIQKFLSSRVAEWGNETTMQLWEFEKFKDKNYFPIQTDDSYINAQGGTEAGKNRQLKNMGAAQHVKKEAIQPLILNDFFSVFAKHIDQMSSYSGFVPIMFDINKFINYKELTEDDGEGGIIGKTRSVREGIKKIMGPQGYAYIDKLMGRINGVANFDDVNSFSQKMVRNMKISAVGFNMRVIIQQPVSYLRAMNVLDPKYLTKALVAGKNDFEEIYKYAPIAQWKDWGYFEIEVGRSIEDLIAEDSSVIHKIQEWSTAPAGAADRITWGRLWKACEYAIDDKHPELQKEHRLQAIGDLFSRVIDETQVVDSVLHRSQIMRSQQMLNKMGTAFMSEPTKTYNMVRTAIMEFARNKTKDNGKKLLRCYVTLILNGVGVAAAAGLVDMLRDDDDEKKLFEKWRAAFFGDYSEAEKPMEYIMASLGSNLSDNFNPMNYIPFVKDIFSMIQGYKIERSDMVWLRDLIKSVQNWKKYIDGESKYTVFALIENSAGALSRMTGLPVAACQRDLRGIADSFVQYTLGTDVQYANKKLRLDVGSEKNMNLYMKKMLDAKFSGNTSIATRIYNDMINKGIPNEKIESKLESGEKKRLEALPQVKEAAEAFLDGDAEGYAAAAQELLYQGFTKDIVEKAIKAEKNRLKKGEEEEEETYMPIDESKWSEDDTEIDTADYELMYNAFMADDMEAYAEMRQILMDAGKDDKSIRSSMRGRLADTYEDAYAEGDYDTATKCMTEFYRLNGRAETLEKRRNKVDEKE